MTLDLTSIESYKKSALKVVEARLKRHFGELRKVLMEDIRKGLLEINAYDNLSSLRPLEDSEITIVDECYSSLGERCVLSGRFFWEHAAAGEATRLGLGNKYMLNMHEFSAERIQEMRADEAHKDHGEAAAQKLLSEDIVGFMGCEPKELAPFTLGCRHMLQMAFDVKRLANKHRKDPVEVLSKQKTLIIVCDSNEEDILKEFKRFNFFGLSPGNVFFMVQQSFHGIDIKNGRLFYEEGDNKQLHNHGQMAMQRCHDDSIFCLDGDDKRCQKFRDYHALLRPMKDLLSYNIEDIAYLTGAIDYESLGFALTLGAQGYDMLMEIVAQNPFRPQKGGACYFDKKLGRKVMIESNQLSGIRNEDIKHLNKNFNHYPNPAHMIEMLRREGLNLPFDVKAARDGGGHYIYPCPVQGDINFRVKCDYVMRKQLRPISNLKSAATMPPTIAAMRKQDSQDGFLDFADRVKEGL
jgi:hypothetical protein